MNAEIRTLALVDAILDGKLAGRWIHAAARRFRTDLERTDLVMDWESVDKLDDFVATLNLVGDDTGKKFMLADWQLWVLANLWGWRWVEDGRRRVKLGVMQVARGNGKTTLMAALALWDMIQAPGRRVHVIANSEHQAEICLDTARTMVGNLEGSDLEKLYDRIIRRNDDCEFTALPALERSLDGLNPSCWIADEAAEFKGRFLTKLLTTGAKRRESLGVIISTPGSTPDNLYGEIIATCEQVLRGEVEDDSMMPMLFGLDPTDPDDDPEIWPKANPGIEYGQPDPKSLRRAFQTMRQSPAGRAEWNRYHCCRMTEGGHNWLDMQKFPLGNLPNSTELEGRAAWIGLDLSKRGDMTALVVAIPLEDGRIALEGHYWWPAQDVAQRELDYRLPIRTWAAAGKITLTPGSIINYEEIAERIDQLALRYKIQMIAYDQYGARDLVAMLTEHNLPIQAYSMGVATFAPGCQLWQRLWVGERLCLGEDPILRAACRSAIARRDRIGNITIGKERDSSTIDALVAAIIAVHSWGGDSQSVYEQSLV